MRWTIAAAAAVLFAMGCSGPDRAASAPSVAGQPPTSVDRAAFWTTGAHGVRSMDVAFDDLAPAGVSLEQCWNAMGMDDRGRIYIGFTSNRPPGGEDFAVFRYDPSTRERTALGTLMDVARAAGNLREGEALPKGHTRLIVEGGKVYLGSQGFHDLKWEIDDLPRYRGAHLFEFDIASSAWRDLAAALPGGVVLEHQGIIALGILRDRHLLVGLTHPNSDLVFYDYETNALDEIVPGIPWAFGNPLSREIVIARSGRIYTYRGTELPSQREAKHPVWVYDPATGKLSNTGFEMTEGFWVGQTQTRDGRTIYLSTTNGRLYAFDTATEKFTDLGSLLPKEEAEPGRAIRYMYGVTLSPDEKKLYYVPAEIAGPSGSGELYSYDLADGRVRLVDVLPPGIYTTADLRDPDHIYFSHFGTGASPWSGRARLSVIDAHSLP